jgi:hypothetical protein
MPVACNMRVKNLESVLGELHYHSQLVKYATYCQNVDISGVFCSLFFLLFISLLLPPPPPKTLPLCVWVARQPLSCLPTFPELLPVVLFCVTLAQLELIK